MTEPNELATAHRAWDENWADPKVRAEWLRPESRVIDIVPTLRDRGVTTTLDAGCGLGRHAHELAARGFRSFGIDASETGIEFAKARAADAGFDIDYRVGAFTELPYDDEQFGYVLAWNVIYHGDGAVARAALAEIARVLAPGGVYQATMLSTRHAEFGLGNEVRRRTFVREDADDDKRHPHLYCDRDDLNELHRAFEWIDVSEREQSSPGSFHWEFTLGKPES